MVEELRAELNNLFVKLERSKKVDSMLQTLQYEECGLIERTQNLKAVLSEEENDVSRLERTTATSILYSLLGNKTEKLNKEQQEAYAAKLKYDAAVRQLDDCRARMSALQTEKDSLSGCAGQYEQIYSKLLEALREDPAYAEKLGALERQRGGASGQLKELYEAINAGILAMSQIESIEKSLGSAENWGTWDLIGGGLISDLAKHSKLDEAQSGAEQLQVLLSRFHTELADVRIDAEMGALNIGGFLQFADFFFDGLIADWTVLSRIQESLDSVHRIKWQVADVLSKLSALRDARAAEKADLDKQISELVSCA